jgi:hypothetical protein
MHFDARPDQLCRDIGLQVGEPQHEVGLKSTIRSIFALEMPGPGFSGQRAADNGEAEV